MNRTTVLTLNEVNRDFYRRRSDEFGATRQSPWEGWLRLMELVQRHPAGSTARSLLDVGCGNGRFARFLKEHHSRPFSYTGVDASTGALQTARSRLAGLVPMTLLRHDVVAEEEILPPEARRPFSLVVAFGLLHHVPSHARRRELLIELARRVELQGILAISIWQFGRFERFRKKIVPWEVFTRTSGIPIDTSQLETRDHILTWGSPPFAHRYCHFIDREEASRLLSSLPLEMVDSFSADGKTGNLNRYYVLRKG
jgi:SAM-dependent methyltransferase